MKTTEQLRTENEAIRNVLAQGPETRLRSIPGVLHVSVGLKETAGRPLSDQLCIRVYVEQKKNPHDLPIGELIPAEIDGIPTDVNTIVGEAEFQADNSQYRPIKGGIQITNRYIDSNDAGTGTQMSRGTLGCTAIDQTDNAPVLLSNWHVLTANTGGNGDRVYQPAPTALPPLALADLPFSPNRDDNDNRIGVIRRHKISRKVDGAIAAIDVSSCCNCCGIRSTNEINALSVGGRPTRNTIVGDERAVSGMTVFKVGQATLRTEGVVVDATYPTFGITKRGTTYDFDAQIAIQNINSATPFSAHGDSGSVVISSNNKVVGLLFADGRNVAVGGVQQPFISFANHIADVLGELNIRIPYSADVVITAGAIADMHGVEAPLPAAYRALHERLTASEATARLLSLASYHRDEVIRLINHARPVLVAWHRSQGPALFAVVMAAVRDGSRVLPRETKGVALVDALQRMRAVLMQHGSVELATALVSEDAETALHAFERSTDLDSIIDEIARTAHSQKGAVNA